MNIQQLRYVVATAERGSMTAAAASVYVAQPALSRAVRSLERELSTTLFEREGRGVRPTAAGRAFADRAARVLDSIDTLRRIGEESDPGAALVIAASPTMLSSMAIPTLAALREQGVAVHTRLLGCGSSAEVAELVAAGRADLGLCDQLHPEGLTLLPLGRAEVKVYAAASMGLPERLSPAALAEVPLVVPPPGTDRRAAIDEWFDEHGLTPTIAVESDERTAWLSALFHGLAACIWYGMERMPIAPDRYVSRSFEPPMHWDLLAVHRSEETAPALLHLLDVLRRLAELETR